MRIPKGMTEKKLVALINSIIDRMAHKFVFGYYSIDDIKQEAFIIALDGLNRYEEGRPLENFLSVHISNRLKTFKRDNFFRKDPQCEEEQCSGEYLCDKCLLRGERVNIKKNLMNPINIYGVNDENEKSMRLSDTLLSDLIEEEIVSLINQKLPMELKLDYQKMLDGANIQTTKKQKIEETINSILEEAGYEERYQRTKDKE